MLTKYNTIPSSITLFTNATVTRQFRPTARYEAEQKAKEASQKHKGYGAFEAGRNHLLAKDYVVAINSFNAALELEPKEVSYLDYRAYTYAEMGDYTSALKDYDELISRQPKRPDYYAARASVHLHLGNLTQAQADVNRALSFNSLETQALKVQAELAALIK